MCKILFLCFLRLFAAISIFNLQLTEPAVTGSAGAAGCTHGLSSIAAALERPVLPQDPVSVPLARNIAADTISSYAFFWA